MAIQVKERIRKMLARGLHVGTPEAEAASSMRLAEKLLAKHNLKQVKQGPGYLYNLNPNPNPNRLHGSPHHIFILPVSSCTQADILQDDHT